MSVQSEIERISGKVSESLAKVAAKGVTVPDGAGVNELPGLIESISGSGGSSGGSSEVLDALIDRSITEISNDNVTSIGFYAFAYCMNLTTVDLPACESIGAVAFGYCINLTTVVFPAATNIGPSAFAQCTGLTTVDLPVATSIGIGAFQGSGLTTVVFPAATSIGDDAFSQCTGLTTVDFPVATSIGNNTFRSCTGLTALILRSTEQACTLSHTNSFIDTPIATGTGYIYVPAALVDSYKAATNWTTYADQIRAIEDYPDICGG